MIFSRNHWETASDPFAAVRTGWSEADFDRRTDETSATRLALAPNDVVLDYGCGPGYACKLIAPRVRCYVGMDYSGRMLDIARRRNAEYANADFVLTDGTAIPAEAGTFDAILCELVFQHLCRDQQAAIAREMWRVLRPGGRMLLQFPTGFYGEPIGWTREGLAELLPDCGIVQADAHYFYAVLPAEGLPSSASA